MYTVKSRCCVEVIKQIWSLYDQQYLWIPIKISSVKYFSTRQWNRQNISSKWRIPKRPTPRVAIASSSIASCCGRVPCFPPGRVLRLPRHSEHPAQTSSPSDELYRRGCLGFSRALPLWWWGRVAALGRSRDDPEAPSLRSRESILSLTTWDAIRFHHSAGTSLADCSRGRYPDLK